MAVTFVESVGFREITRWRDSQDWAGLDSVQSLWFWRFRRRRPLMWLTRNVPVYPAVSAEFVFGFEESGG